MASPDPIPVGSYTNVAGVIAATPAGQVAAVMAALLALVPDTTHPNAQTTPPAGTAPIYDKWSPELAAAMRAEIAAAAAAIAAAPTS